MLKHILLFALLILGVSAVSAQQPTKPSATMPPAGPEMVAGKTVVEDTVMVTIILKHQQDKNLPEIRRVLEAQGFWDMFPTSDTKVVSWTIAMGLGHIIILKVPAGGIRRLNLALENGAWGAFDTEIYLSYDYGPVWKDYIEKREEAKEDRN